jgi:hypothetical protein
MGANQSEADTGAESSDCRRDAEDLTGASAAMTVVGITLYSQSAVAGTAMIVGGMLFAFAATVQRQSDEE